MPKIKNVLLSFFMELDQSHYDRVAAALPGARIYRRGEVELTDALLADIDVLIGDFPNKHLAKMTGLKWFHSSSSGVDVYLKENQPAASVVFTNSTGIYGEGIGEHMLAMLLALTNRLHQYRDNQLEHRWHREGQVLRLPEATVLVAGLGDIGSGFARRVKALGATVWGVRRREAPKPDYVDRMFLTGELESLLPQVDVVALSLPDTAETTGFMDRQRLSLMKPGAFLLNVGRGSAIDTDALVEALEQGTLGGAGLDVTDPEPLPEDHPLWQCKNALITPHTSGFYHNRDSENRLVDLCVDNIQRYLEDKPLRNCIDRSAGYRADA